MTLLLLSAPKALGENWKAVSRAGPSANVCPLPTFLLLAAIRPNPFLRELVTLYEATRQEAGQPGSNGRCSGTAESQMNPLHLLSFVTKIFLLDESRIATPRIFAAVLSNRKPGASVHHALRDWARSNVSRRSKRFQCLCFSSGRSSSNPLAISNPFSQYSQESDLSSHDRSSQPIGVIRLQAGSQATGWTALPAILSSKARISPSYRVLPICWVPNSHSSNTELLELGYPIASPIFLRSSTT